VKRKHSYHTYDLQEFEDMKMEINGKDITMGIMKSNSTPKAFEVMDNKFICLMLYSLRLNDRNN
jgi:hypothetical protein